MKILWLYRYTPKWAYNHWYTVDFFKLLNTFSDTEVKFYGYNIEQAYEDMMLIKYSPDLLMQDLKQLFDFDVIIMGCKNRMFTNVDFKECWLPKDFNTYNCPKILLEEDYFNFRKDPWVKDTGINLILHRHKNNVIRGVEDFPTINQLWFPFSVNTALFKPNKEITKINKIAFVGSYHPKVYYFRNEANKILENEQLIDFLGQKREEEYIESLQKYTCHLNGSLIYSLDNAKMMEIMASGSVLFTNDCYNGSADLFGKNTYVTYRNDFSDLIQKSKFILENENYRNYITKNALKVIRKKHSHQQRCTELLEVINGEIFAHPRSLSIVSELPKSQEKLGIVYCLGNIDDKAIERFQNSYKSIKEKNKVTFYISEVGKESNKEIIKKLIPNCEYYYQYNDIFDASIAKNNAFKYLIMEDVFIFLDIDIIVFDDFVTKMLELYNTNKKAFVLSYIRLEENDTATTYCDLMNSINSEACKIRKHMSNSALIICDKSIYKLVNGFDEEYRGWGYRDVDFNLRINLLNKLINYDGEVVFHQYHLQDFENQENNKKRYDKRKKEYSNNIKLISKIKGLEDLTDKGTKISITIENKTNISDGIFGFDYKEKRNILIDNKELSKDEENTIRINEDKLRKLHRSGIEIYLLSNTCYEIIANNKLSGELNIAVDNVKLANKILGNDFVYGNRPKNTRKFIYNGMALNIPYKIINYLQVYYGIKITQELKKKKKRLRLINNYYKFIQRK